MFFSKFCKRRKIEEEELRIEEDNRYVELVDKNEKTHHVVDMCEQMIDAAREFEDAKQEYDLVTSYLSDIEIIEGLPDNQRKSINEAAYNIARLNKARNDFMKTEQKLSDSQFLQMQEMEDEIPAAINRLKSNEEYLDTINKDLKYLAGEKTTWEIGKEEYQRELKQMKSLSVLLLVLFAMATVLLFVAQGVFEMDTQLAMVVVAFITVCIGAYVFLKYQDCVRGIKKCDINRNHAISLENRVKIKYVNMKNAVDYACEKYHVNNSYELNYNYEQYIDMVRDRELFRRTSDELEYYNRELVRQLERIKLYDTRVWINYANALVDKKDMVELKHDLLVRRQKLRTRMEYNVNAISELRSEILLHKNELGDRVEQINKILRKISELNMSC